MAIYLKLNYNFINRDNGIEIPETRMPTIRQYSKQSLSLRTAEETVSYSNNVNKALDGNPLTMSEVSETPITDN